MFDLKNQIILNDVVYAWPPFHKLDGINPFLVVLLIISLWQMEWWWNWFIPQTKHTNSHPPTVRSNNEFNLNCTQKKKTTARQWRRSDPPLCCLDVVVVPAILHVHIHVKHSILAGLEQVQPAAALGQVSTAA